MTLQKIEADGELLALIARNEFKSNVLDFISDKNHSFQIGFHNRKPGERAKAHQSKIFSEINNLNPNKIYYVKKGKVGCDIYDKNNKKIDYVHLNEGDLICFISGGHGVDFLEETEMIEIKQGPYRGTEDDKRFFEDKLK